MKSKEKGWFSQLLSYADGSRIKFTASIVLSVLGVTCSIMPYYCMYRIIDSVLEKSITRGFAVAWALYALGFFFINVLFFGLSTGLSHLTAFNVLAGLRSRLTDRFMKAPLGVVQNNSIGDIKNVMVDKIEGIEPPLAHMVPEGAGHIVMPLVSIALLAVINWRLALASLVTFPVSIVCMGLTFKISGQNFTRYNESNAVMNSTIVEYIEGIEVIKAFGRSGTSYKKYADAITDYRKFVLKWLSSTWITMKLAFTLFPSTMLGVLPMGLFLCSRGTITVAETALAVMISMSMVGSLSKLEVFTANMTQLKNTVLDVQKYLDMEELEEGKDESRPEGYGIKLRDVRFSYTGDSKDEVLHGINLDIRQGSFTALVGPSGGGKSTVAKLIARFWDTGSGEITIGGVNIRNMSLKALSDYVSFVTQDNFLFNTSILENIRVGNPRATDDEVKEAARRAQCQEFIERLPDGYNTSAGEAGKKLSGGEKQRIAIARMILKDAPVVILDEATAFTDPENEDKIQKSIAELTRDKTLLVIAHRLSTIKDADSIVVLKDGEIVSQGRQEELLDSCPLYQSMWKAHVGARNWGVTSRVKEVGVNV